MDHSLRHGRFIVIMAPQKNLSGLMSISLKDVVKLNIGFEVMLQDAGAPKKVGHKLVIF